MLRPSSAASQQSIHRITSDLPKPPLPLSPWNQFLADFNFLQEHEIALRDTRERWMRMAHFFFAEKNEAAHVQHAESLMTLARVVGKRECFRDPCFVEETEEENEPVSPLTTRSPMRGMFTQESVNTLATLRLRADSAPSEVRESVQRSLRAAYLAQRSAEKTLTKSSSLQDLFRGKGDVKSTFSRTVWNILEDPTCRRWAIYAHMFYAVIILLSVVSTILITLDDLPATFILAFGPFDFVVNGLFSVEVLVRLIVAPSFRNNLYSTYFWMDVAAVVPFYIRIVSGMSPTANPTLELISLLIPIVRLLKITRHSNGWRLLVFGMRECVKPLGVPFFFLTLLTVFSSCTIYWIEKYSACRPDINFESLHGEDPACPKKKQNAFESVAHAMWYSLVTVCTVGYGDVTPNTVQGKLAGSLLVLIGVFYCSMPLAIVGQTFWNVWEDRDLILIREKTTERFRGVTKQDVQAVFSLADIDGSGSVGLEEFLELIEVFDIGMPRSEAVKMFRGIDVDRSGEISFEEFASFLFPEVSVDNELEETKEAASERKKSNTRLGRPSVRATTVSKASSAVKKAELKPNYRPSSLSDQTDL